MLWFCLNQWTHSGPEECCQTSVVSSAKTCCCHICFTFVSNFVAVNDDLEKWEVGRDFSTDTDRVSSF